MPVRCNGKKIPHAPNPNKQGSKHRPPTHPPHVHILYFSTPHQSSLVILLPASPTVVVVSTRSQHV